MTRVAFASCMKAKKSGDGQKVWDDALAHQPEWLILCGDNMYMDWGLSAYEPKGWSLSKFAEEMHNRYAAQFSSERFRRLVQSIPGNQVIGVWDDHDFAWNNCFGAESNHEMPSKKKIATAFYHHYFSELNKRPLADEFPHLEIPDLTDPPKGSDSIYRALDIGPLRVLLCDGRSWRSDHPEDTKSGSLLGTDQEAWLFSELSSGAGPFMLVSGSTMTGGDDQSWDYYQDFFEGRFLPMVQNKLVMFLAGDVHENRLPPQSGTLPIEIVSSGARLGFPLFKRNFGVLDIQANSVSVFLYKHGDVEYTGVIDLESRTFTTSMAALADDSAPSLTVEQATLQREKAIVSLHAL